MAKAVMLHLYCNSVSSARYTNTNCNNEQHWEVFL